MTGSSSMLATCHRSNFMNMTLRRKLDSVISHEAVLIPGSSSWLKYSCTIRKKTRYRSLTQLCTQIRAEFRPLYLTNTFSIPLSQSEDFVEDIIPRSQDLKDTFNLVIDIRQRSNTRPIDILPFLCSIVSQTEVHFHIQWKRPEKGLARILNKAFCCQRWWWEALMMGKVEHVYLRPNANSLAIIFKDNGFEEWIMNMEIASKDFWHRLGFKARNQKHVLPELSNVDCFRIERMNSGRCISTMVQFPIIFRLRSPSIRRVFTGAFLQLLPRPHYKSILPQLNTISPQHSRMRLRFSSPRPIYGTSTLNFCCATQSDSTLDAISIQAYGIPSKTYGSSKAEDERT
ncbi:hypothetical protein GQ44DRAFT_730639 [Phaeosphaeriaceae sp. PMI808]|nr:hypothetical protein GQ44DRAFT_730639 [Phaeosphaeriaceae sp. PMI808]